MPQIRFENGRRVIDRWDDVFRAVSAEPRRQVVLSLMEAGPGETVSLPENAVNPNVPEDSETLRYELHHCHLPVLADREFVEWETDPFVASRGPRFDEVAVVFEALQANSAGIPDSLVVGCQRLERERHLDSEK
ncbi:hypothetical protein [Halopelagius longus]|uniref:ArsR family transcriptional regulator n=1 Tax=Halopelagius longus TaxID=1236180 RepID=A0A1H0YDN3_9EURY|nr:hypothetical protein [Halopelagius longus]RDI72430.1 hypothetical protein DWB78_12290 [Halopelagius longus]SDQ13268.1 hypothetical protein SAMN05216278_0573 [Halopelagius longus]